MGVWTTKIRKGQWATTPRCRENCSASKWNNWTTTTALTITLRTKPNIRQSQANNHWVLHTGQPQPLATATTCHTIIQRVNKVRWGQAPMDIDAIRKGKGKHNNKGKEKAKESTKEKATEDTTATGTTIPKEKGNMEEKDTTITIRLGMATLWKRQQRYQGENQGYNKGKGRNKENKWPTPATGVGEQDTMPKTAE